MAANGNSPLEYIQRAKIEFAKRTLETTRKNINEVMFEVGYSDVKSFRMVLKNVSVVDKNEIQHHFIIKHTYFV